MIMQLVNSVIIVVFNWILGGYSYLAIGAVGIYFRVQSLIFMPVMGLTQGMLPIIGFAYGAHRLDRMKLAIKKAALISFALMSVGFLAFQLIPRVLVQTFNNDPGLVELGVECMRTISLLLPLVGPGIVMSSTFQAVGKGFTAMWLSLLRQVILLLPLAFILPRFLGINGVWLSFPVSDLISISITAYILFLYMRELEREGIPKSTSVLN